MTIYPKDVRIGQIWQADGYKWRIDHVTNHDVTLTWIFVPKDGIQSILNYTYTFQDIVMNGDIRLCETDNAQLILSKYE